MTSFEIFINTIKTLSRSQGFYTRAYNTYLDMTEEERINLENYINLHKNYKNSIDVVMDLEG